MVLYFFSMSYKRSSLDTVTFCQLHLSPWMTDTLSLVLQIISYSFTFVVFSFSSSQLSSILGLSRVQLPIYDPSCHLRPKRL